MTKTIARDNKGRFCSPNSSDLKSMSLLIDTENKNIDAKTLINLLNTFYGTNVKFVENAIRIFKEEPARKCYTKFKVKEPSINFTVSFETV